MTTAPWSLAIDFGTSNTAAAESAPAGPVRALPLSHQGNAMPSAVYVRTVPVRSADDILVGDAALNAADADPAGFVPAPKRLVGTGAVPVRGTPVDPTDAVAAVLGDAYRRALRHHNAVPPERVVLTHPEAWPRDLVAVLTTAAGRAGIDPSTVTTVSEPRAAAHFYTRAAPMPPGSALAVFDFGGGTVDVAILRATDAGTFDVVAARGDNTLGGKTFDALVSRWALDRIADRDPELAGLVQGTDPAGLAARRALDDSARRAKEVLSGNPSATVTVAAGHRRENLLLTRSEFDDLVAPKILEAAALVREALSSARVPQGALQAIYLTGGSSRIPLVHQALSEIGPVATLDDPKTVVARGALVATARPDPRTVPMAPSPERAPAPREPARGARRTAAVLIAVVASIVAAVGVAVWWPDGASRTAAAPGPAETPDVFTAAAGGWHTCADRRGEVSCWGFNTSGQLGDGTVDTRYSPVSVSLPAPAVALGSGREHSCAVTDTGDTYCWGYNTFGQLGDGTDDQRSQPVRVVDLPTGVSSLSAGEDHTCALTDDGGGYCWGRNDNGQVGDERYDRHERPQRVDLPTLSSLAAGGNHTCASTVVGDVFCWGANTAGQLGRGHTNDADVAVPDPLKVELPAPATYVVAGREHTCAVLESGRTYCWGGNGWGQLGDGTTDSSAVPVESVLTGRAVSLAAGTRHTCAVTDDGVASCWGTEDLGRNTSAPGQHSSIPTAVGLPAAAVTITVGTAHTCATTVDAELFCWGENGNGELGNESTTASATPVRVTV
ncbi:MAG: Hsp70 family protein [Rhodococcus sp.]|uniref:RCC1 domain-containing protein n=1 Tax=Rhodococcus TaxID=1827 RepID=UPI0016A7E25B|nr:MULTISPECIES: Hsp70 family protein [Rhodococcus]NLV78666.1 Hsp70 family protein [Rhodococcus sp. (in: high G+C Gram-positive bacteria)]